MKIIVSETHQKSCAKVAAFITDIINNTSNPVLGLATGGTVEHVYEALVLAHKEKRFSFKNVYTVNLDEYLGLDPSHPQSYRYFMNTHLFNHVDINIDNTYVPLGNVEPSKALLAFQEILLRKPRDFQLLGLGANGHIAFNEPASELHAQAHIVSIAKSTIEANARYFDSESEVPSRAFTQGMGDILKAKKIVLLATGDAKIDPVRSLLGDDLISPQNPCSFLKTHSDVSIFIDSDLAMKSGYEA